MYNNILLEVIIYSYALSLQFYLSTVSVSCTLQRDDTTKEKQIQTNSFSLKICSTKRQGLNRCAKFKDKLTAEYT